MRLMMNIEDTAAKLMILFAIRNRGPKLDNSLE